MSPSFRSSWVDARRSDGHSSAIGEVRLLRHNDNVAVMQSLPYLNSTLCILAEDDANALSDAFSDSPHIGLFFLTYDGALWNCDMRFVRPRCLLLQETHLDTHFRFNNLH